MDRSKSENQLLRVVRRWRLYWSMLRYGMAHNRDFAVEHYAFFDDMLRHLAGHGLDPRGLRVLDVGCGKSYWLTLLLHSYGAKVTGIDTEAVEPGRSLGKYAKVWRENGLERTMRTLIWDFLFARPYYRELGAATPFPLRFTDIDVRRIDGANPPFAEDEFDLIVSHEVLEHIADIPRAVASLRRALKRDGLTYLYVHNFCSLSGGHHIAWKYPDKEPSDTVPPWDHLREKCFPDIPSWVNGLREREYRDAFEAELDIVDWVPRGREGETLLKPDIRAELDDYSDEELLTKGFVIMARPRPAKTNATKAAAASLERTA